MRSKRVLVTAFSLAAGLTVTVMGQQGAPAATQQPPADDPIAAMVGRLDLERYKATIKGLTQFGDRRQGTERNRKAVDWIEAQLKSYGCTNTERIKYVYPPEDPKRDGPVPEGRGQGRGQGRGGDGRGAAAAGGQRAGGGGGQRAGNQANQGGRGATGTGAGGSTIFGTRGPTGVNTSAEAQPDLKLRELNSEPTSPGPREEVYCTKIGTTRPDEMYIVGGHMDGHGWGEAANDDGSGTALVMELARIFSSPDVQTERSIRFILWNNEETGLNGARAYIAQRQALQGREEPAGSRRYPEPKWLGVIQHDMMMFDHGMPGPDGKVSPEQRREADVNVEFQINSKMAEGSMKLAWHFKGANARYATDYPATVGPHMTNTDSVPFQDIIPSISLRENERGAHVGAGWDPHWHQVTDVFATFSDKDFRLGLNAAQTTLGAVAQLAGATVKK